MSSYSYHKKRKPARRLARHKHRRGERLHASGRPAVAIAHQNRRLRKSTREARGPQTPSRSRQAAGYARQKLFFAKYLALLVLLLATPLAHDVMQKRAGREAPPIPSLRTDTSPSVSVPEARRHAQQKKRGHSAPSFKNEERQNLFSGEIQKFHSAIREKARLPLPARKLEPVEASRLTEWRPAKAVARAQPELQWRRFALVQTLTLGIGGYGFQHYNGLFGGVEQSFKIGNDWNKDHTLHFDELLHFQGAYRITQSVSSVYRWAGVAPQAADWIGFGTSALIMTSLEYIDGRRKNDQASYSDLAANFLGMGFALARARASWLQDFDLRLSYRTLADPFRRSTVKRYDRITHWLTYDLNRRWKIPLHLGLGYSVVNVHKPSVKSQYYFGIGISPSALIEKFSPSAAKTLEWLDFYHFGNQVSLNDVHPASRDGKRRP